MSQNKELQNDTTKAPKETANEATQPALYTEEQVREIYNEGQKSGYLAAIKTIRSNLNDYLDNLIIAAQMNKNK